MKTFLASQKESTPIYIIFLELEGESLILDIPDETIRPSHNYFRA